MAFHFKQFDVCHDRCAMKVGTDGVLLGAWVLIGAARRMLDVGTGSGLIALMLAQRGEAAFKAGVGAAPEMATGAGRELVNDWFHIDAVELDAGAAGQAAENISQSPWARTIQVSRADILQWNADPYDLIVSNPPFFQQSLKAPAKERCMARHDESLTQVQLAETASRLLNEKGRLAVIWPTNEAMAFESVCWPYGLYLNRLCAVSTQDGQPARRMLMEFSRTHGPIERTTLSVETVTHKRTEAYSLLTADFYR